MADPDEGAGAGAQTALARPGPILVKGAWAYAFDPEENDTVYSRALLDKAALVELQKREFLSIGEVRALVDRNSAKENQDIRGEQYQLDGEVMHVIDIQVDYPVFITDDNVYTREELVAKYPFAGLRTTPESVFSQQEIAVFPASGPGGPEYVTRDLGSEEPFMTANDLVKRAIRGESWAVQPPAKVTRTKIFVGRAKWKTFLDAQRFFNVVNDFVAPALTAGPADSPTLSILDLVGRMAGLSAGGAAGRLLLGSGDAEAADGDK